MAAQRAVETGWPGEHVACPLTFLANGGELGRWVGVVNGSRVVAHASLSAMSSAGVPPETLALWGASLEAGPYRDHDPFDVCVEVGRVVVHPEWRGRGVAAPFVETVVRRAAAAGRVRVASTFTDRSAMRALFVASGWVELGTFTGPRSGRSVVAYIAGPETIAAAALNAPAVPT